MHVLDSSETRPSHQKTDVGVRRDLGGDSSAAGTQRPVGQYQETTGTPKHDVVVVSMMGSAASDRAQYEELLARFAPPRVRAIEVAAKQCFVAARAEVQSLLDWSDGWDGANALAPKRQAVLKTLDWIGQLEGLCLDRGAVLPSPHVACSAHGEVVFEWWNSPKKLTVYFTESVAEFVRVWGLDIETEMHEGAFVSSLELFNALSWLAKPGT